MTPGSRLPAAARVLAFATLFALAPAWAAPAGTVFTANERANSISRIQLETGARQTIQVEMSPHNVQVSPDGKRLLAVGVSAHAAHHPEREGGKGQLLVWDLAARSTTPATVAVGDHPAHVVTDAAGTRAFVTDSGADAVHVVDLASLRAIGRVSTGKYPHGLRLSPDGKALYVANMKDGTVSVVDVGQLKETARIPVGAAPVQVGFSPDGSRAFVSLSGEDRLGIIDTGTRRLVGKVGVGSTPIQMMATLDARYVYVANQGTSGKPADTVSVVDVAGGRTVGAIRTGKGAHGVAMSRDGSHVFVTNIEAGTLSVIDTATRQVVATHRVGAGPNGVTWTP